MTQSKSLLLCFMIFFAFNAEAIYFVKPNTSLPYGKCPGQPCLTLDSYTQESGRYFTSGSKFQFLSGNHSLLAQLNISAVSDISFQGTKDKSQVIIICFGRITLQNVTNFHFERITYLNEMQPGNQLFAFRIVDSQSIEITDSIFRHHQSGTMISSMESYIAITRSLFAGSIESDCTAISAREGTFLTVSQSNFTNNHASGQGQYGGAIFATKNTVSLSDVIMYNNSASSEGGGIYCNECFLTIMGNSDFHNNSLTGIYIDKFGGAISIISGHAIVMGQISISNNKAVKGGGISLRNTLAEFRNGTITFRGNVAEHVGGGLYVSSPKLVVLEQAASITSKNFNFTFIDNEAYEVPGSTDLCGVVCIYATLESDKNNYLSACSVVNNSGTNGGAMFIEKTASFTFGNVNAIDNLGVAFGSIQANVEVAGTNLFVRNKGAFRVERQSNVTFSGKNAFDSHYTKLGAITVTENSYLGFWGNTFFENNNAELGGGVMYLVNSRISFKGYVAFSNNTGLNGGAIFAERGNLDFDGELHFVNNKARLGGALFASNTVVNMVDHEVIFSFNSADKGGAMYLKLETIINLEWLYSLTTISNTASEYGGAIYHEDFATIIQCSNVSHVLQTDQNLALTIQVSFLQILGLPITENTFCPIINSYNDSASKDGSFLFGGLLDRSRLYDPLEILPYDYFTSFCTINIFTPDKKNNAITSDPFQLEFCDLDFQDSIEVYRGQTFKLRVVALGQGKSKVSTAVRALTNPSARLNLNQSSQYIPRYCSIVKFNLFSSESHETLTLFPEGPCETLGEASTVINVTFRPCPNAFNLSNERCVCEDRLKRYGATCEIEDDVSIQKLAGVSFWMSASYYDNGSYGGLILSSPCPAEYCIAEDVDVNLDDPDVQCAFNRSGVLCGKCTAGYSSMLGGYRCRICSNIYLTLLLPFALGGIVLVVFLSFTKMTVATGAINSFILYANFVQVNKSIFFPLSQVDVLTIFIAWMNLDLGFEICFYNGMDVYVQTWLQYAFSLYVWSLISLIILISRYSITVSKLIGSNPIAVLATLLLMSYNKILKVVIDVFSSVDLEYPNEKHVTVWLKDGNLLFLTSKHLILSVFTIFVALLIFLPYTIFLLLGHLLYHLRYRRLYYKLLIRIKPLLDSYYAPYKVKTRYWTGLLLLIRCALYVIFSFNSLGGAKYSLLAINIAFSAVAALSWLTKGVYQHFYMDAIEVSVYINLIMLSISAATLSDANKINIVSHGLVGVVFTTAVGATAYQIHLLYLSKSSIWIKIKSTLLRVTKNSAIPADLISVIQNTQESINASDSRDWREPLLDAK